MRTLQHTLLTLTCWGYLSVYSAPVEAHFIWLATTTVDQGQQVEAFFGEEAAPDDPDLLTRPEGMQT